MSYKFRRLGVLLFAAALMAGLAAFALTLVSPAYISAKSAEDSDPGGADDPALQSPSDMDCALGIGPVVFHEDNDLPTGLLVPQGVQILWPYGYYDVMQPVGDGGQGGEVAVGDTLVAYLYLVNNSGRPGGEGCPGGSVEITVTDVTIKKNTIPVPGSALGGMTWPDPDNPQVLQAAPGDPSGGDQAYTLFPFEVGVSDTLFQVRAEIEFQCTGGNCADGFTYSKEIWYPGADLQTPSGATFQDLYGSNPRIKVVGPRATITVVSPPGPYVAEPFEEVPFIIKLTSMADDPDSIVRITDDPEAPLPKCSESIFANPDPDDPSAGWYANTNSPPDPPKVDTTSLTDPLGDEEPLWCHFTVVMDPAIINDDVEDTFTLTGGLVVYNATGQSAEIEVEAPPVSIEDASISVVKRITNPDPGVGVRIGETVTYEIEITNTGQVPLQDLTVVDSLVGPIPITDDLPPDDQFVRQYTYDVGLTDPSPLINTVTVTARTAKGFEVEDSA
ncbi:MAG: hypothetical protein GYB66_15440, partial [Chloroflexi bacterium]|nr:hypothetical protein [Chloroflexota bacterium]